MAYKQNSPFNNESDDLLSNIKNKNLKVVESSGEPQPITTRNPRFPNDTYTNINERGGEGNRVAYIPTYESLIHDERGGDKLVGFSDSPRAKKVYEIGEKMVSDSLNLVNKGQNVAAAQTFGRDLSSELRKAKNMGEYDAVITKINRGHQDERNLAAAQKVADMGQSYGTDPTKPKLFHIDDSDPSLRNTYDQKLVDRYRERYN